MAFNVQKIHPLDLQPRKAVGVKLPFTSRAVFESTYTTKDALKSNIINYFLTEKGERFLNPGFGAGLRLMLFEQITTDTKDQIAYIIRQDMAQWFPDVNIRDLVIKATEDTNTVAVAITYDVSQTNIQDQVVINFEQ